MKRGLHPETGSPQPGPSPPKMSLLWDLACNQSGYYQTILLSDAKLQLQKHGDALQITILNSPTILGGCVRCSRCAKANVIFAPLNYVSLRCLLKVNNFKKFARPPGNASLVTIMKASIEVERGGTSNAANPAVSSRPQSILQREEDPMCSDCNWSVRP